MLFSSTVFIFWFLPAVILGNLLLRWNRSLQNVFLCFASLFFYAWGEPWFVFVMIGSIIANWLFGLLTEKLKKNRKDARPVIAAAVFVNLSVIFIFKYLGFTLRNINALTGAGLSVPDIALPIGISFFTFQALSYVIDVYRGKGEAQKNVLNVGLYISFFPQLIAGPIVRYETIENQIRNRVESFDLFSEGVERFIIGLGKKVIIANNMALIADKAFALSGGTVQWFGVDTGLSPVMAWLGAAAYTFQIYYDFSGYSDMAIGLGRMFGFRFNENFNYPYIADSVTDFWHRWHISLSTWFRDYVYIPLGGSRVKSGARQMLNLFIVWLLTGIWHGANWTFIVWGLAYFVLLVIEKRGFDRSSRETAPDRGGNAVVRIFRHAYVMFFVILLWVVFRADSMTAAVQYIGNMFDFGGPLIDDPAVFYLRQYWPFLIAAAVLSTPVVRTVASRMEVLAESKTSVRALTDLAGSIILIVLFIVSVSYIVMGSYNPFIYFNF